MGKKSRLKKERKNKKQSELEALYTQKPGKQQKKASSSRHLVIYLLLLIAITSMVYWRSLDNDFVNLDDNEHVYKNPNITSLDLPHIKAMFTGSRMGNWIPLTELSFAIDHHFWGMDAYGFHLTNLILHIINTLLVFWLLLLLTGNPTLSLFSALVFALHPLHVESVAWITERKDVLYALFYLLAFILWILGRRSTKKGLLLLSLIAYLLALTAKSMAVTLPLILILYDVFYEDRKLTKAINAKIPFFILAAMVVFITFRSTYSSTTAYAELNILERIVTANYAFWFYPFKLLLPFKLSAIYPYPQNINQALPAYYYIMLLLTALLARLLISIKGKGKKYLFWFWFYLLTILPVLHFLPLAGSSITCDRFTYLPSLGIFMILLLVIDDKFKLNKAKYFVLLIIAVYAFLSWQRIGVWKNGVVLHTDIIASYPDIELPYINRGKAYSQRGEHGKAIADFTSAIKVSPSSADAYNNRGNEYGELRDYEAGIVDLNMAIKLRPGFVEAYNNRAHLYMSAGMFAESEADFTEAITRDPDYATGWYNRGNLYRKTGEYDKAIADYDQVVKLDPNMATAYNNRGTSYSMSGRNQQAISDFNQALALDPGNLSFLNNRGNAWKDLDDTQKALEDFNQAIRINPGYSNAYHNRAVVYYSLDRIADARKDIQKVKELGGYVNPAFENALDQARGE
ncbi:MAG: tetratricopeptide repeat protein [Candidatus Stygibacter australis]|nr:tetratricopeptide repeat protein [Candidatus Stygibacter australis]